MHSVTWVDSIEVFANYKICDAQTSSNYILFHKRMNVLGIRDPSADSFPNEIARPIDSTSIIVFNVKPLQTCPCWCFSLRVPSVAADVLLSLCRSDYLYDIFLFIKLIVTCGANCLYTYHTAEVHTHYHPLLIFFLQLLLPTLIHLLVSKWEVSYSLPGITVQPCSIVLLPGGR